MAKSEYRLKCGFNEALAIINNAVMNGSMSASCEDRADYGMNGVRCSVRVYERYSWTGKNRVSMSVTVFGQDGDVRVAAVTSGGSQAVFFKINTLGERSFLTTLDDVLGNMGQKR